MKSSATLTACVIVIHEVLPIMKVVVCTQGDQTNSIDNDAIVR